MNILTQLSRNSDNLNFDIDNLRVELFGNVEGNFYLADDDKNKFPHWAKWITVDSNGGVMVFQREPIITEYPKSTNRYHWTPEELFFDGEFVKPNFVCVKTINISPNDRSDNDETVTNWRNCKWQIVRN